MTRSEYKMFLSLGSLFLIYTAIKAFEGWREYLTLSKDLGILLVLTVFINICIDKIGELVRE